MENDPRAKLKLALRDSLNQARHQGDHETALALAFLLEGEQYLDRRGSLPETICISVADTPVAPMFDIGMTAHVNGQSQSANPHDFGTEAHSAWAGGWLASEARVAEIAGGGTASLKGD